MKKGERDLKTEDYYYKGSSKEYENPVINLDRFSYV